MPKINEDEFRDLFLFFTRDLTFVLLPIIVLIIVKSGFLGKSIIEVISLPNFAFANVVLMSMVLTNYIKQIIDVKRGKKSFFYSGINFLSFFLIISVLLLVIIILHESNDPLLNFPSKTFAIINLLIFIFATTFLYGFKKKHKEYFDNLYDTEKKSSPIVLFNHSIDKLKNVNSNVHDTLHLVANSKTSSFETEEQKHSWKAFKGRESIAVCESIINQIENNIATLKKEISQKKIELEQDKTCSEQ